VTSLESKKEGRERGRERERKKEGKEGRRGRIVTDYIKTSSQRELVGPMVPPDMAEEMLE
jgi:hypothetical protein